MHDNKSVAHEIYLGRKEKKDGSYRTPFITIWHVDPETDGSDDSCGNFIRTRHLHKETLEKIRKEFEFQYKNNYWFDKDGQPKFSTIGILTQMYYKVLWIHFDCNRKKCDKFMRKYLHDIIHLAENEIDCLGDYITNRWGYKTFKEQVAGLHGIIYADICRKLRPWWKHPRWHVHHWQITFPIFRSIRRRYWDKCSICGKRGFPNSDAHSDWSGKKIWHGKCAGIRTNTNN